MTAQPLTCAAQQLLQHQAQLRAWPGAAASLLRRASAVLQDWQPASRAQAYALQDALIQATGAVVGWKVGGAHAPEPSCAPIFANRLWADAAPLPFALDPACEYECEIGFVLAQDLPPRETPYGLQEVRAAIGAVCATVELLAPRFEAPRNEVEGWIQLADGLACGGLVVGAAEPGCVDPDCEKQWVRLERDGLEVHAAQGGVPAVRLLPLVQWLANHLAARGWPLRRGQVVTTGSWTGVRRWNGGRALRAEFTGLAQVALRCPG